MKLLRFQKGEKGIARWYRHPRLGAITVLTIWGGAGSADVIHIETDRERATWRAAFAQVAEKIQRTSPRHHPKTAISKKSGNGRKKF